MDASAEHRDTRRRLAVALALNAALIAGEFGAGWWVHSLGLISDACHNFVDQATLFLTAYAHLVSAHPASARSTFGRHRVGVVAAFGNALLLLITTAAIGAVAIRRLLAPETVQGAVVAGVAMASFAANLLIALILRPGSERDLNVRAAFWHMFGDAWVSLGVAVSGALILWKGWTLSDPIVSLVVAAAIGASAWPLLSESLGILLESAPRGLSLPDIRAAIEQVPGVRNAHDLHLWSLEPRLPMMTCHVLVAQSALVGQDRMLDEIQKTLEKRFGLRHLTIQVETVCHEADATFCDLRPLKSGARRHE